MLPPRHPITRRHRRSAIAQLRADARAATSLEAPTRDDVRALFHGAALNNPPSRYFDLENQKASSRFPPGKPPEWYDAFIAVFDERAQTADAQAHLDARKGRTERARRYADLATRWRDAARVATMRKQRALDDVPAPLAVVCAWCTPQHTIRPGRLPASHGMCPIAEARMTAELDARERALRTPRRRAQLDLLAGCRD